VDSKGDGGTLVPDLIFEPRGRKWTSVNMAEEETGGSSSRRQGGKRERSLDEVAKEAQDITREALEIVMNTGVDVALQRGLKASQAGVITALEVIREMAASANSTSGSPSSSSTASSLPEPLRSIVPPQVAAALPDLSKLNQIDPSKLDAATLLSSIPHSPQALRRLFERLGSTYIKLGQFIASSPTLFPPEYVKEFQKCLDKTEPLPWAVISKIIQTELGKPLNEVFSHVEPVPLASASIAQVHAATLKTGESVVLKVQKPDARATLQTDLGFILILTRLLQLISPDLSRLSLSEGARDIRAAMLQEVDFLQEMKNIQEFDRFLQNSGMDEIAMVPRVYPAFSTEKLLTMDRLEGVPLNDVEKIRRMTKEPELAVINALNVWSLSVIDFDFFHGDVHAGNLLLLRDGRIGFIDFGIVGRISRTTWEAVRDVSLAAAKEDYLGMASALQSMGAADGAHTATGKVDTEAFAEDIRKIAKQFKELRTDVSVVQAIQVDPSSGTVTRGASVDVQLDDEQVTRLLLDLVAAAENNGLKLPREFVLLIKQALYFDRYVQLLAPELDYLNDDRMRLQEALAAKDTG